MHHHNWINHPGACYNPTWTAPASDGAQEGGLGKKQEHATDLPREDHRLAVWACRSLNSDSAWPREIGHRAFQQDDDDEDDEDDEDDDDDDDDAMEWDGWGLAAKHRGLLTHTQCLLPWSRPDDGGSHGDLMGFLAWEITLRICLLVRVYSNSYRWGFLQLSVLLKESET